MDKIPFDRIPIWVQHDRDGLGPHVSISLLSANQIAPARSAEDILTEGKLILEIILVHDPGRTQAAAIEIILNVILLQHHFFEDFGKGITAWVSRMFLCLRNRSRTGINEMPNGGVTTYQNKLLKRGTHATCLEQPEHTFHSHVHDLVGSFLAGCQMHNMRHAIKCFFHFLTVFNGAVNGLDTGIRYKFTMMT